jgi:uncharacterized protein YPO0396
MNLTKASMMQPFDGYALEQLQIYNWGTFNGPCYTLRLNRQTALLTGKNGSGKSTIVDALLTLLVPNRRRYYNLASGDKRGERSEKSYVRGAYSRLQESGVRYLRDENEYSVILGTFHSPDAKPAWVTLAQVFWNGGANKFHVVAPAQLSFQEHFASPDTMASLRKKLRGVGAETFEQFNEYSAAFRKYFRLRSENALDLFSRTTSLKEIGSLNQFIREHMLEKTDIDRQIQQLRDNFQDLTVSYDAIVKAQRQQALLEPIMQDGEKYAHYTAQIKEARDCEAVVPHYFKHREIDLLTDAIQGEQLRAADYQTHIDQLQTRREQLDAQRLEYRMALERDESGRLLQRLREDENRFKETLNAQQNRARRYDELTSVLEYVPYHDSAAFHENRQRAEMELHQLENESADIRRQREKKIAQWSELQPELKSLRAEIESLQAQRSQIPRANLEIRRKIADALSLEEEALPFAGELMHVRDEEQAWVGALERVLHGFSLTMLVDERYYKPLSLFVNKQNLGGKLDYRRLNELAKPVNPGRLQANALYHKIEVKQGTPFTDWLRGELARSKDYVCVDTIDDFRHERRALTITGQIKHDQSHHEKNDRYDIRDRKNYVLGWDNRAKLEQMQADYATLHQREERLKAARQQIMQREDALRIRLDRLKDLLREDEFTALDWYATQSAVEANQARQREVSASSNQLRQIEAQLAQTDAEFKQVETDLSRFIHLHGQSSSTLQRYTKQCNEAEAALQQNPFETWRVLGQLIHTETEKRVPSLTLDDLPSVREDIRKIYANRATTLTGHRERVHGPLLEKIAQFRSEYRVETESIGIGLDALTELQHLLARIMRDDLPKHQQRFKEMLDKKVRDNISGFHLDLETQTENYREVINQLNESLRCIPYEGDAVYIQLKAETNVDVQISDFRAELRACLSDASANTSEALNAAYERIRALIHRFENPADERWMRKVTDVRMWLDFAAVELWRDDDSEKRHHSDSSGMSGGQKAKLAYTILASAVAYQYGTQSSDQPRHTFRFVVVDEAFSKVDDSNAHYAMALFQQLGLQLLVITPMDKIQVVESYVGAYHFVYNNEEGNKSQVVNLTAEELAEKRRVSAQKVN